MAGERGESSGERQGTVERRMLRSRYHAVKNLISGRRPLALSLVLSARVCSRFGSGVWVLTFEGGSCMCADERDEMARADSDRFTAIIQQVDCLHEFGKDRLSVACERLRFFFLHFRKRMY